MVTIILNDVLCRWLNANLYYFNLFQQGINIVKSQTHALHIKGSIKLLFKLQFSLVLNDRFFCSVIRGHDTSHKDRLSISEYRKKLWLTVFQRLL